MILLILGPNLEKPCREKLQGPRSCLDKDFKFLQYYLPVVGTLDSSSEKFMSGAHSAGFFFRIKRDVKNDSTLSPLLYTYFIMYQVLWAVLHRLSFSLQQFNIIIPIDKDSSTLQLLS